MVPDQPKSVRILNPGRSKIHAHMIRRPRSSSRLSGAKNEIVHPAHLLVERGMELLVLPIAEIVAGAQPVADAQQHVAVAES